MVSGLAQTQNPTLECGNNGKANGRGTYVWKNGDRYEGEWKDCLKNGKGEDNFSNGDVYKGFYKDGKPHGKGVYKWKNGSTYHGEFCKGKKHGKGKWQKTKSMPVNGTAFINMANS
jgi:hypothetical protein